MTGLLTVNWLAIFFIIVCFVLLALWLYIKNVNKRLSQSIGLINDLYKLNQSQATSIAELLGDVSGDVGSEPVNQLDTRKSRTAPSDKGSVSLLDKLVAQTSKQIKESVAYDVQVVTEQALSTALQPIESLSQRILALENQTQLLQQEDPALKMYSRANQLLQQGASIEDIMEASHLPRAEVEVLVSIQRPKKTLK